MLELKPILQKFLADLHQVGPGDRALVYRLANLADGRIRAVLGSGPAALSVDFEFPANLDSRGAVRGLCPSSVLPAPDAFVLADEVSPGAFMFTSTS
jgi:hypothetical protein